MDVYVHLPEFDGKNFKLRGSVKGDAEALLKVYSDEKAVPLFNSDNCHGDDFHYTTLQRMQEAVDFWIWSYENRYFVRWTITDKNSGEAIGTIELFHRDSETDDYGNTGVLRLDLRSDYEKCEFISEILALIKDSTFDLFYCDKIATKVKPFADERLKAVKQSGYIPAPGTFLSNDGVPLTDYYVLNK